MAKRILFSGYAPVHFLCFLPVYRRLCQFDDIELSLSGGFRVIRGDEISYRLDGFYEPFDVDKGHIRPVDQVRQEDFDVVVCAHLSDALFPRSTKKTVQIFHGVSFKNLLARDKALAFDFLCLPGRYHLELFQKQGLVRAGRTYLKTGFSKSDSMVDQNFDRQAVLASVGATRPGPTILFAPTGDHNNTMETRGTEMIEAAKKNGGWNLLIKPHDHPKKAVDWFAKLKRHETDRIRVLRDRNVVPYLRAADLLVTDASSVAVEYTLLDRPIVFLDAPRLMKRIAKRAPALDLDTYGRKIGSVVPVGADIAAAIFDSLQNPGREGALRRQMAEHVFHEPGKAAERITGVVRYAAGLADRLPSDVHVVKPS